MIAELLRDVDIEQKSGVPKPKTYGCHHNSPTCKLCEDSVERWRNKYEQMEQKDRPSREGLVAVVNNGIRALQKLVQDDELSKELRLELQHAGAHCYNALRRLAHETKRL